VHELGEGGKIKTPIGGLYSW